MAQPQPVASPFPPGTREEVIWVGPDGRVLPSQDGAVRGEITLTFPDGRVERMLFTLDR